MEVLKKLFKSKYILNSMWLIIDKLFLLVGGLLVSILVVRYLGPENYGRLTYGLTLSILCTTISQWGASYTIFNTATKDRNKTVNYIVHSYWFRTAAYILTWLIISLFLFLTLEKNDAYFISLVCFSNIFLALDIYQYYFNGTLNSKVNAIVSMKSKVVTIVIRLILVFYSFELFYFIIPVLIEGLIVIVSKWRRFKEILKERDYSNLDCGKEYILFGMPFLISNVLVFGYTKINEILLQNLVSFIDLGLYNAGFLIANAWTFLPLSIGTSLITKALRENDISNYSFTYFVMFMVSLPLLVFIGFFSLDIVSISFGSEYLDIGHYLLIMSISAFLGTLGFLNNRHIASLPGGGKYLSKKIAFTTLLSLLTSFWAVSNYGIEGAVFNLFFVEVFSLTLGNYLYKGNLMFKVHLNVFNLNKHIRTLSAKI